MRGTYSAYGGGERRIQGFDGKNLQEKDNLGDSGLDERIILRWIFRKWVVRVRTGSRCLRIGRGDWHLCMR